MAQYALPSEEYVLERQLSLEEFFDEGFDVHQSSSSSSSSSSSRYSGDEHMAIRYLFDMPVSFLDIAMEKISIPVEFASGYFPCPPSRTVDFEIGSLSRGGSWRVRMKYDSKMSMYELNGPYDGWILFAREHGLKPGDRILFYELVGRGSDINYLIVKRGEANKIVAEFYAENFIFEHKVTGLDYFTRSIYLPMDTVRNCFPAVGLPSETHKLERVYFTDLQNKEWCAGIHCEELYFRVDLHGFFDDHNVRVGNIIRFYQPVMPSNVQSLSGRCFLIQCVKGEEGGSSTSHGKGGSKCVEGEKGGTSMSRNNGKGGSTAISGIGHCCVQ